MPYEVAQAGDARTDGQQNGPYRTTRDQAHSHQERESRCGEDAFGQSLKPQAPGQEAECQEPWGDLAEVEERRDHEEQKDTYGGSECAGSVQVGGGEQLIARSSDGAHGHQEALNRGVTG